MRLDAFDKRDGYRVWLNDEETRSLIDKMEERGGKEQMIACKLGVECGLRRDEASQVRPIDVSESLNSYNVRIWEDHAKQNKYREAPLPRDLAQRIEMIPEYSEDTGVDDSVLDVTGKTLNRWVKRAGTELYSESKDEGWKELTFHDLRRTWGVRLLEQGVLPSVVMKWGGWEDWDTFREHYLDEFSPHALQRERGKVDYLSDSKSGGDVDDVEAVVTATRV